MPATTLIVGGNRGIGLGLVEDALKRDSTGVIFVTARDVSKADALQTLAKKYPGRLIPIQLDMLDEATIKTAISDLKKYTSTLDTVIINAGVLYGQGHIEDLTAADLLQNLNGNIVGPHNITKAFSPFLLDSKADKKQLVYISSVGGSLGALPMAIPYLKSSFKVDYLPLSGYCATKSGLNMLGRQWADSLEPKGVSVLLVHPGGVSTDMNDGKDTITVAESAKGVLDAVAKATLEDGAKGIVSYDGTTVPW
ncbi:hypothetical protein RQP46_010334 [Phenoliferia psychrophenolica]